MAHLDLLPQWQEISWLALRNAPPIQLWRMAAVDRKLLTREILLGFWKVHILHHAAEHPVVGQWMIAELRRHGYEISPGTLYPLLKRMERNGWLRCELEQNAGPRGRRYYHLTARGASVLNVLRKSVSELRLEVLEHRSPRRSSSAHSRRARTARSRRG